MPQTQQAGEAGAAVVPRWEWRVFGRDPPLSAEQLHAAVTGPERRSAETYILRPASPHNVKIRGGAVEVKRLEEVHPSGLERWRPTLRATFPVDPPLLAEVWDALGVPPPGRTIPFDNEAALLGALPPGLRAVRLEKRRRPLTLRGCPGEWVTLTVDGQEREGLALEHPDPALLLETLRWLHFDPAANTNYPRALAQLTGCAAPAYHSGA